MIVNLTPHPLTLRVVCDGCGGRDCQACEHGYRMLTIESSGVARCVEIETQIGWIDGIPVVKTEYGAVEGLPEPVEGTSYVVSSITAAAVPYRRDVFVPTRLLRDDKGRIVGCAALGKPAKPRSDETGCNIPRGATSLSELGKPAKPRSGETGNPYRGGELCY